MLCHMLYTTPSIVLQYGLVVYPEQFDSLWGALVGYIKWYNIGLRISITYWVVFIQNLPRFDVRFSRVRLRIKINRVIIMDYTSSYAN
jgi:hypothetical protein